MMPSSGDLIAGLTGLSTCPRLAELAWRAAAAAVAGREGGFGAGGSASAAGELAPGEGATPFGDLAVVLAEGPRSAAELALLAGLVALGAAADSTDTAAARLVWLGAHTRVDALGPLDAALGPRAEPIWREVARIAAAPSSAAPDFGAAEALTAAAALGASGSQVARALAAETAAKTESRLVRAMLGAERREGGDRLSGELARAPRGPLATVLLAGTGLLALAALGRLVGRFALGYRRPAEVTLDGDGLRLAHRTELLGRVLRDRETRVPFDNLARATREVRFSGLGLYAGLLALTLGSFLGVGLFVDGVRAGSGPLLGLAAGVIALGLVVDFALATLADAARGRCRLVVVPRKGRTLAIGGLEPARADALLARLKPPAVS
ncbi:MAG: hypothetical protein OZ921_07255 [Sorangiineae bacterium]|nr:hypothetical protein [Sorangiineae bacterium]